MAHNSSSDKGVEHYRQSRLIRDSPDGNRRDHTIDVAVSFGHGHPPIQPNWEPYRSSDDHDEPEINDGEVTLRVNPRLCDPVHQDVLSLADPIPIDELSPMELMHLNAAGYDGAPDNRGYSIVSIDQLNKSDEPF